MAENIRSVGSITWANSGLAGQRQPIRWNRKQSIRSILWYHDFGMDIDTANTEVLSPLETLDRVRIEYDNDAIEVLGDEISVSMAAHYGRGPLVGGASYRDLAVADNQDFDSVVRLPVGCPAAPELNIEVSFTLSGETIWSETVANTPADLDSVLYLYADYVDTLAMKYATWGEQTEALAAERGYNPPNKLGEFVPFATVVCRDDDDAYTAETTASAENTLYANYEDALTYVEVQMGETTHRVPDFAEPIRLLSPEVSVIRRSAAHNHANYLRVDGAYIIPVNLKVNALPVIRLNAATSDTHVKVWFATPLGEQAAATPTPAQGKPVGEGRPDALQQSQATPGTQNGPVGGGGGFMRVPPPPATPFAYR